MESQYSTPQMTLTNLLIGAPPATTSNSHLPDMNQQLDNTDDIYRGSDPRSPIPPNPGLQLAFSPTAARSDSSSSSSSSGIGFNIIPSVIEHAITRWARGRGLRRRDSSSSDSSNSSISSTSGSAASGQRKHRKKSTASLLSRTTTLTTRRQARAMSRAAPREFVLFLPKHLSLSVPSSVSGTDKVEVGDYNSRRELKTSSLKLVLAQLGIGLKQNAKSNRLSRQLIPHDVVKDAARSTPFHPSHLNEDGQRTQEGPHVAFNVPIFDADTYNHKIFGEMKKGKGRPREVPRQFFLQEKSENLTPDRQPCWWLDIASPTWDDMRALGKLLQLHPLTLEDILQKESREKFELFPRLGYYFVIFRAVERRQPDCTPHDDDGYSSDDGNAELTEVLDVTNVYLVVFKEGICTFHFEDISLHMESVRRKVLQLEGTMPMGSDWIAHGLMDSIVDAFFPLLKDIQKEVLLVEDFVSGLDDTDRDDEDHNPFDSSGSKLDIVVANNATEKKVGETNEKFEHETASKDTKKKEKQLPLREKLIGRWRTARSGKRANSTSLRDVNRLRRMTITRRLVTTLGRLLSAKLEVIAQIRKRLNDQGEVTIYLGDVQDHIISLNQSLIHYERMLSHSHPAYVTHLRFSLSEAKGGMDRALVLLTLVSSLVLCNQVISSLCGMNVNVPISEDFRNFGVVVAVALIVSTLLLVVARYWYVKAHGGDLWIKLPWRN